jgi:hypothetical protein
MKLRTISSLASILLIGCTAQPPNRDMAPVASRQMDCINQSQIAGRHPSGPHSIVFEMVGGPNYRNDLPDRCPNLEHADQAVSIVIADSDGSRLCRNDAVKIIEPGEARATGTGAFAKCRLGEFTPIAGR